MNLNPGRNALCPCNSGKKYKNCCGQLNSAGSSPQLPPQKEIPVSLLKESVPISEQMQKLAALLNARQFAEAESNARELLAEHPNSGAVWKIYAISLAVQEKDSLHAMGMAAKLLPADFQAHSNLGNILKNNGEVAGAIASFQRALEINANIAELHNNLGSALQELGRIEEAIACYIRALAINPDFAEAYCNLGSAQQILGRLDDAVANYQKAIEIKSSIPEMYYNLGNAQQELELFHDAILSYANALKLKPDYAEALGNFGSAKQKLGQIDIAVASYEKALEMKPDYAEGYSNLASAQMDLGEFERAEGNFNRAIAIQPGFPEAHWNLSMLLLAQGRYAEAWPLHEFRFDSRIKQAIIIAPDISCPRWDGESLLGKSLIMWPEQGYGDYIQFVRYASLLKQRGLARLTLFCAMPLKALFETIEGVDLVVSDSTSIGHQDFWSFPLSLPLHFKTTVESIPAMLPYLHALPKRIAKWHERLPLDGIKVGLVWKGSAIHENDAERSLPDLNALAPLWGVPGVTFVSLQKGLGENETVIADGACTLFALGSDIVDFADTAAIVAQLDLVICVDTAVAHLTAGLGKPCWVLLPFFGTDWRWLLNRSDSPWYPGVLRLFRQTKRGDWTEVINEVRSALESMARSPAA